MHAARIELLAGNERRGAARLLVDAPSTLRGADDAPVDVTVCDLSRTGFRVETDIHLEIGATVTLGLGGAGAPEALVIRRDRTGYGCAFILPLTRHQMARAFAGTGTVMPIETAHRRDDERAEDRRLWSKRSAIVYVAAAAALVGLAWIWAAL